MLFENGGGRKGRAIGVISDYEPKRCPLCTNIFIDVDETEVSCCECGCSVPVWDDEGGIPCAIERWNTRGGVLSDD